MAGGCLSEGSYLNLVYDDLCGLIIVFFFAINDRKDIVGPEPVDGNLPPVLKRGNSTSTSTIVYYP